MTASMPGRRTVLTGAAAAGGAVVLSACGPAKKRDLGAEEPLPDSGTEIGKASEVPVGGGKIYEDEKIVATQPSEGEFKAFSAVCTHQGCLVGNVKDNKIGCPCHGSIFSAEDGSVIQGPAKKALANAPVKNVDGTLTLS